MQIGDNVIVEEFVSIKPNTVIGDNCVIMAGCVLGANGLEYKSIGEEHVYIEHVGGTVIGNNVVLHSNVAVPKAVFPYENTIIEDGTKVDTLTLISHGSHIGENCIITAGTVTAGRVTVGDDCFLGPGTTVAHNLSIGNSSVTGIGSVVTKSLEDNSVVSGNFAIEHQKFIKHIKEISK